MAAASEELEATETSEWNPEILYASYKLCRHYKGGRYLILFEAMESSNGRERKPVVIYASLDKGTVNVRDKEEFFESVEWPDGARRSRFSPEQSVSKIIAQGLLKFEGGES